MPVPERGKTRQQARRARRARSSQGRNDRPGGARAARGASACRSPRDGLSTGFPPLDRRQVCGASSGDRCARRPDRLRTGASPGPPPAGPAAGRPGAGLGAGRSAVPASGPVALRSARGLPAGRGLGLVHLRDCRCGSGSTVEPAPPRAGGRGPSCGGRGPARGKDRRGRRPRRSRSKPCLVRRRLPRARPRPAPMVSPKRGRRTVTLRTSRSRAFARDALTSYLLQFQPTLRPAFCRSSQVISGAK